MFTYALLYFVMYFLSLLFLYNYLIFFVNFTNLQDWSVSKILAFILSYNSYSSGFLALFLLLSGLPPVTFFLIKLSFLMKFFSVTTLIMQFLLFFNFLAGMIFYLQIFNTNFNKLVYTHLLVSLENQHFSLIHKKKLENQNKFFFFWYFFLIFLCFNFFSIFFFFDFYLIFSFFF